MHFAIVSKTVKYKANWFYCVEKMGESIYPLQYFVTTQQYRGGGSRRTKKEKEKMDAIKEECKIYMRKSLIKQDDEATENSHTRMSFSKIAEIKNTWISTTTTAYAFMAYCLIS
jgi:hypothetical protein